MIRGNASKRTARHFGLRYDYRSRILREAEPVPAELQPVIERAEKFAGLEKGAIVEALGAPCAIQFRAEGTEEHRRFERCLMPRSAYMMRDAARDDWQHRIPPTKSERFSLTLRSLIDGRGRTG